jgi:phosphatidylethanolamine/phosphatidyl-N-methylethanolamine N-methyltransferase
MWLDRQGFIWKFLLDPGGTGALAPATTSLARTVARVTCRELERQRRTSSSSPALRLIELGAGTGALTRAIRQLQPLVVERDESWAHLLRCRFPGLEVRSECATRTLESLDHPVGVVTSIPMLNNPQSQEIGRLLGRRYAEGLIKFCVLYTYGWADPLGGVGFRVGRRESFVARSFPPASVWVYR